MRNPKAVMIEMEFQRKFQRNVLNGRKYFCNINIFFNVFCKHRMYFLLKNEKHKNIYVYMKVIFKIAWIIINEKGNFLK